MKKSSHLLANHNHNLKLLENILCINTDYSPHTHTHRDAYFASCIFKLSEKLTILTRSGQCEPIETSTPAAALCQSALNSYKRVNSSRIKKINRSYITKRISLYKFRFQHFYIWNVSKLMYQIDDLIKLVCLWK